MAKPYSNVVPQIDTFAGWLQRTNDLSTDMSTIVITTSANSIGASTSGNAALNGIFSANTLVSNVIRGGTVSTPATMTLGSNLNLGSFSIIIGAQSINSSSGIIASSANTLTTSRNIALSGDAVGNTNFNGSANVTISVTLANSGVTAGSYGNTTYFPVVTVDSKGRVTAVTTQEVIGTGGGANAVSSFNTRTGAVTLNETDINNTLNTGTSQVRVGNSSTNSVITSTAYTVGNNSVNSVFSATGSSIVLPQLRGSREPALANSTASGAMTLDLSYNVHRWVMTGNITSIAFSNQPANNIAFSGTLYIQRDGSANSTNRVITFPSSNPGKTLWSGGSAPPPTSVANAIDIYQFFTVDGGNNYIWSLVVKDAK